MGAFTVLPESAGSAEFRATTSEGSSRQEVSWYSVMGTIVEIARMRGWPGDDGLARRPGDTTLGRLQR
jgi:hypothetical protein